MLLLIRGFERVLEQWSCKRMPAVCRAVRGAAKDLAGTNIWLSKTKKEMKEFEDAELSLMAKLS